MISTHDTAADDRMYVHTYGHTYEHIDIMLGRGHNADTDIMIQDGRMLGTFAEGLRRCKNV